MSGMERTSAEPRPELAREELAALAGAARAFGELLLFELDAARLGRLQEPELAGALAALGVEVPMVDATTQSGRSALDALAAEFYAALLAPRGGAPPVQSLWEEGRYEGGAARRVSELAAMAGVTLDTAAARGAQVDHLGCVLLLWAEAAQSAPAVADAVAAEHLAWATRPLGRLAAGEGFYAAVARATEALVATLCETRTSAD